MMRQNKFTLKMQLSMLFIAVLTVLILFIIVFVNRYVLDIITKNTEISRLSSFSRVQSEMMSLESNMVKLMQYIVFDPLVDDLSASSPKVDASGVLLRKSIGDLLDKLLTMYPEVHSFFIQTSNGDLIGTEGIFNYNSAGKAFDGQDVVYNDVMWESNQLASHVAANKSPQNVISLSSFFKFRNSVVKITINIKEPRFFKMYEPFSESKLSNIYICDYNGKIISAGNASLFENTLPFFDNFDKDKRQGSFMYKHDSGDKQIIYMGLDNVDWLIVEEIPLKQYTKDISALKQSLSVMLLISVVFAIILSVIFIQKAMSPFKLLITAMNKMRQGNIGYQITDRYPNEFGEIVSCFNSMSYDISELIENNKKIEAQKTKYAIAVLKAQINPHFLFNTLNMIKWMAVAQHSASITQALEMLMAMLKPIFKERLANTPLTDEIVYLQNYIKLINLRFGGEIVLDAEIPPELASLEIPQFILQPIIENCIEHGFNAANAKGRITVRCSAEEKSTLVISDNGQGMSPEVLESLREQLLSKSDLVENGDKIGIVNVNLRLKLMRGEKCGLTIESQEGVGTTVTVKLQ